MSKCTCVPGEEYGKIEIEQPARDIAKVGYAENEPADVVKFVAPYPQGPWKEKSRHTQPNIPEAIAVMRRMAKEDSGEDQPVNVEFVK